MDLKGYNKHMAPDRERPHMSAWPERVNALLKIHTIQFIFEEGWRGRSGRVRQGRSGLESAGYVEELVRTL